MTFKLSAHRLGIALTLLLFATIQLHLSVVATPSHSIPVHLPSRDDPIQFFALSDIHLDLMVRPNASKLLLCRFGKGHSESRNLEVEDQGHHILHQVQKLMANNVHYSSNDPPSPVPTDVIYGRFGCDTFIATLKSLVLYMQGLKVKPKFVLVTGDWAAHLQPTGKSSLEAVSAASTILESFDPSIQLLPVIGNNDVFPDYTLPIGPSPRLDALAQTWARWIPHDSEANKSFRNGGYYSIVFPSTTSADSAVYNKEEEAINLGFGEEAVEKEQQKTIASGLRVIVLNSLYWSKTFIPLCAEPDTANVEASSKERKKVTKECKPDDDPAGQFAWLSGELDQAQALGQRVIIAGHIPPGNSRMSSKLWKDKYTAQYLNLTRLYSDIISFTVWGHNHEDTVRVDFDESSNPSSLHVLLPSLSPIYKNNPSFRVMKLDPKSYDLMNWQQHFMDLRTSNRHKQAFWRQLYDFREEYGIDDSAASLNATTMAEFLVRLEENADLLSKFERHRQVEFVNDWSENWCSSTTLDSDRFKECSNQHSDDV